MFRALPIEGHKNIIQPAIFGVSRWLPFEGEKRNLSKWFSFDPSRCLPDGREIFKTIHKNRVFVLYHLREKTFNGKGAVFGYPRCLPIEGRKKFFSKGLIFGFSRDLPLEGWKLRYRHNFWPFSVETSERENKNFVQAAIFGHSRCLLFEGRKFFENDSPNSLSQWE